MTLKELEALYWAGTLGSFALASERLCMTQSSLSKRILELEGELGVQLFDRSGPKASITDVGQRILLQAKEMLDLRDAILVTARGKHGLRGICRFGVSELVASTWLADIVALVRQTYPEVILEPRVAVTQELTADVQRGDTDFAIGPVGSTDASIASKHLLDIQLVWACAPTLLAKKQALTLELLQQYPVISMSAQAGITAVIDQWAIKKGLKFQRIVASNSASAVASLTASGLGVCLLAKPLADAEIQAGRLRAIPIEDQLLAPPSLSYFISWRQHDTTLLPNAIRDIAETVMLNRTNGPTPVEN